MEIEVVEKKANRLLFRIKGEGHTLANLLKEELVNMPEVDITAYEIDHPLIGIPEILVQTKNQDPIEVLKKVIEKLKKDYDSFAKTIIKVLK